MGYKVMLIGLGGIGYNYDKNIKQEGIVYTHAKALAKDDRFDLVCAVDMDELLRREFSEKYDILVFSHVDEALLYEKNYDLVIVATPTFTHLEIIEILINRSNTKNILLEKPISDTYRTAKSIVELCKDKEVSLFVNYIRRSDLSVRKIKNILEDNWANQEIKGVCWYTKGWMHNASHFFNLLEYWLGECKAGSALSTTSNINGFEDIDTYVEFERGAAMFLAGWECAYSYYSIELMSPVGKISYLNGGDSVFINGVKADQNLAGYKVLDENSIEIPNTMCSYQAEVLNQIANYLNGKEYYLCTGKSALATMFAMDNVILR